MSQQSSSGGIGLGGLLTVIFVVAKLFGLIGWSWLWVFSPLWISFLLVFGVIVVVFLLAILAQVLS